MQKFHRLSIKDVRRETRDAVLVSFEVPPALSPLFRFQQGQHLTLKQQVGGEELRRSYSICAAPEDGALRIAIKRVEGGSFSNWANETLRPGQWLEVLPPAGHFGESAAASGGRHVLAIAAGSGITPILSIVKSVLQREPGSHVTLIYGNRTSAQVMFRDELADLKDRFMARFALLHVLSREHQDVELFNGRLDAAKCAALFDTIVDIGEVQQAFVCGPGEMMESVTESLIAAGLPKAQIRTELFATSLPSGPRPPRPAPAKGERHCQVSLLQDGRRREFAAEKGMSVLDAALAQGIELPYSCKGGVCSTCRCKLVAGEVDMSTQYALEDYEIARGFILTCQSYPVSDRLSLDYDQDT